MIFKREKSINQLILIGDTYFLNESLDFPKIVKFETEDYYYYCFDEQVDFPIPIYYIKTDSSVLGALYICYIGIPALPISNKKLYDI